MFLSKMLVFAMLNLLALSGDAEDEVKVVFRCPPNATILSMNWENEIEMSFSEDPGGGGHVKLKVLGGSDRVEVPFERADVDGQKIRCVFHKPGFAASGSYSYTINRKVISCFVSSYGREIRCRLKP